MGEGTSCATAGCFHGDLTYFEAGAVGSWYCPKCYAKTLRLQLAEAVRERDEARRQPCDHSDLAMQQLRSKLGTAVAALESVARDDWRDPETPRLKARQSLAAIRAPEGGHG